MQIPKLDFIEMCD